MIRVGDKINANNNSIQLDTVVLVRLETIEIIKWLQSEPTTWLEIKNYKAPTIVWEHFVEAKVIGSAPNHFCLQYQPNLIIDIYDNLWLTPKADGGKNIFAHSDDVFLPQQLIDSYSNCKQFRINDQWFNRSQFCQHFDVKDNNKLVKKAGCKTTVVTKTTSNGNFGRYDVLSNYVN